MRPGSGGSGGGPDEAGTFLPEMMVGLLILSIAMVMTFAIMRGVTAQTAATVRAGTSTEAAQIALDAIAGRVAAIVTPDDSALASGSTAGPSGPCWGTGQPAGEAPGVTLADPASVAVLTADDFDLRFCGYPAHATTPRVFRIWIDPSTCRAPATSATSSTAGSCTVRIDDLGPQGTAGMPGQPAPATLGAIAGVWCDAACQGHQAGLAPATPALFTYATTGAAGGAALKTPLDVTATSGAETFPAGSLLGEPGFGQTATTAGAGSGGVAAIRAVGIELTLLADTNPILPAPSGHPGTTVTARVALESVS
jgi:type II secretory pathway pseudopilin PulG